MKVNSFFDAGFEDVDHYEDIGGLIQSLDLQQNNPSFLAIRQAVYQKIRSCNGELIEIGCGLGSTLREVAEITNHAFKLTGIDKSQLLIAEAKNRTVANKKIFNYQQADATNLPFPDNSFSFAFAERVLMHIPNYHLALSEMLRVLKKGGNIAIIEPDLSSVEIYPDHKGMSQLVMEQWCQYTENYRVGRDLLAAFHRLGLRHIDISVHSLTINSFPMVEEIRSIGKLVRALKGLKKITDEEADSYLESLNAASRAGNFIFYVNMYRIMGEK